MNSFNAFSTVNYVVAPEQAGNLCLNQMNYQAALQNLSGPQFSHLMGLPAHDTSNCTCHGMLHEEVSATILDAINPDFLEGFDMEIKQMVHRFDQHLSMIPVKPMLQPPVQVAPTFRVNTELFRKCKKNPGLLERMGLIDIRGMVSMFVKTKPGSHFVQRRWETCSPMEREFVFQETLANIHELANDGYANYVVQLFLTPGGDQRHLETIVAAILDRIHVHSCGNHASRVVQKAFLVASEPLRARMVAELSKRTLELAMDSNGNHVVQKMLDSDAKYVTHVIQRFVSTPGAVLEGSKDQFACRVIQKCLVLATPQQTQVMAQLIFSNMEQIANTNFGNFVIQEAVCQCSEADLSLIVDRFALNIFKYSSERYTSNIVEKCLEMRSTSNNEKLIRAACGTPEQNVPSLCIMMLHQYGNYVAQRMFENANSSQRQLLVSTVLPHVPTIRKYSQGREILSKLQRHFWAKN